MRKIVKSRMVCLGNGVIAAVAIFTGGPAFAQSEGDGGGAQAEQGGAAREIVVTAQRRSEKLERTPVTIAVLTSEDLARKNIATEADLQSSVSGLVVRSSQNSNALNYAIRGQTLDPFSSTRPGVLPYINEVQVSNAGGATAFYDLESVQVLKGPQGTLFGRNATGGAVLFTTAKPKNEFSGYVTGRLGNYATREIEGALNVPLVDDKVLLRVAGTAKHRKGYQVNQLDGERLGTGNQYAGRVSLTLRPSSSFENTTVVDYYRSKGSPTVSVLYSLNPTGAVPVIALTTGALPGYADISEFLATQRQRGPFKPSVDGSTSYKAENILITNVSELQISSELKLRNIIGYGHVDQTLFSDTDSSPYQIDDNDPYGKLDKVKQFSEEFQLIGETPGGVLAYTAGLFYAWDRVANLTTSRILGINAPGFPQVNTARQTSSTYAAYLHAKLDLATLVGVEGLSFNAGVRYSKERKSILMLPGDVSYLDAPDVQATYDFSQHKSFSYPSWTVGLQQQVSPNLMVYLASRHSNRSGGFNGFVKPIPGPSSEGGNAYGTEKITDLELGLKFKGDLGGMPTRTSLAIFKGWIKDSQRLANAIVNGAPAAVTVNVPRSTVSGVEYDFEVNPATWLTLGGSLAYTDGKFTRNEVRIQGADPVVFDTFPDTPKWSATGFVELNAPVTDGVQATARADLYTQSSTWITSYGSGNGDTLLPGYTLVNLRLGIEGGDGAWSLAGLAKNVFDKRYWTGGEALGALFQLNVANPGAPRTFMVEGTIRF